MCVRTRDGGPTWQFLAWIGSEPPNGFSIMPSSVRLSRSETVTSYRPEENFRKGPNWIETHLSKDDARTWDFQSLAAPDTGVKSADPPSLVRMKNGRLAMTFGFRKEPSGIRALISDDRGTPGVNPPYCGRTAVPGISVIPGACSVLMEKSSPCTFAAITSTPKDTSRRLSGIRGKRNKAKEHAVHIHVSGSGT